MIDLSDEECKKIEKEVDAAHNRAVQRVAAQRIKCQQEIYEKVEAQLEQEKQDKKLLKEIKGSFFKRLFG